MSTTKRPIDRDLLKRANAKAKVSRLPGYLTTREVGELLGMDASQVSRYHTSGRMPAIKIGTQLLFQPEAVARFDKRPPGNPNFQK